MKAENKSSRLIREYLICKMHFPVSGETVGIDNQLKELTRISEKEKVNSLITNIDYQINSYFNKIGFKL